MKSIPFCLALSVVVILCGSQNAFGAAAAGPIVILTPSGGETYVIGSSQSVRLDPKTKAKTVTIELSIDGGNTFQPLGTINNGSKTNRNILTYTVAGPASSNCIIRASGDKGGVGLSSAFSIGGNTNGAPSIPAAAISSGTSGSGLVLTSDGSGGAAFIKNYVDLTTDQSNINGNKSFNQTVTANAFVGNITGNVTGNVSGTAANVTGVVAIANGGTGSAVKNFVDLSTNQNNIAGNKTFTGVLAESTAFVVEPRPNNNPAAFPNLFIGPGAGLANTTGQGNVFLGQSAGTASTTGNFCTFCGASSGNGNTTGTDNSFFGAGAGFFNTTGSGNCCFGKNAGGFNQVGASNAIFGNIAGLNNLASNNSFFGNAAGTSNVSGGSNAFFGFNAGLSNNADNNAFFGAGAGAANTAGVSNAFFGLNAGTNNTTANFNSFFGSGAGTQNTTGHDNAMLGTNSGFSNTTGSFNEFFGSAAGSGTTTGGNNVMIGGFAGVNNTTGASNTFIGDHSGSTVGTISNATAIGANATVTTSNSMVLGSINGVNGATSDTNVGIGTTAPNSYLQVNGSVSLAVRTVTAGAFILFQSNDHIIINTSSAATYLLPTATGLTGRIYVVKNLTAGSITLKPVAAGETIDGAASITVAAGATVYAITDGANWFKIN